MTNQYQAGEQTCLLNPSAQCNRIWVSRPDGLRLSHYQTLGQEEPILMDGDAAVSIGRAQISNSGAYEQCERGCLVTS
jgi:hypothetical protein